MLASALRTCRAGKPSPIPSPTIQLNSANPHILSPKISFSISTIAPVPLSPQPFRLPLTQHSTKNRTNSSHKPTSTALSPTTFLIPTTLLHTPCNSPLHTPLIPSHTSRSSALRLSNSYIAVRHRCEPAPWNTQSSRSMRVPGFSV